MPRATILPFLVLAFASFTSSADAQRSDKRRPQDKPAQTAHSFSEAERKLIAAYFTQHAHEAKPLPPGIAKNLARGKPLPPEIAKQVLPTGLLDRLPPVPHGFERVIVDGKVLLVEIATQVIHDVLEGLILG